MGFSYLHLLRRYLRRKNECNPMGIFITVFSENIRGGQKF